MDSPSGLIAEVLKWPDKRNGIYCDRGHRLPGQDMP
jgi:hypothetical protein